MIIIHNNNSDIMIAITQTISKSNSVKYINSDYIYFIWAVFTNIYIDDNDDDILILISLKAKS